MTFAFFIIFYFIRYGYYLLETCSFLKRDRKKMDRGRGSGEELGGVKRWKIVNNI